MPPQRTKRREGDLPSSSLLKQACRQRISLCQSLLKRLKKLKSSKRPRKGLYLRYPNTKLKSLHQIWSQRRSLWAHRTLWPRLRHWLKIQASLPRRGQPSKLLKKRLSLQREAKRQPIKSQIPPRPKIKQAWNWKSAQHNQKMTESLLTLLRKLLPRHLRLKWGCHQARPKFWRSITSNSASPRSDHLYPRNQNFNGKSLRSKKSKRSRRTKSSRSHLPNLRPQISKSNNL